VEAGMNAAVIALGGALLLCMVWNIGLHRRLAGLGKQKEPVPGEISKRKESEGIYERMIPGEMLKMLKVKRYSDLKVGDQQYFSSVIMDVNIVNLTGLVHSKKADEVFTSINRMMNQVIPVVYGYGGMVEEFRGGGSSALFLEKYEQALIASVSICENINKMEGLDRRYESVSVGLYYGSVMIGVVGHEYRMTILTLSEAKEFAAVLRGIGNRYGAKIVVAFRFLNQIENSAGKFNYRLLGYVLIRETNAAEKIYDVFDGDVVEVRNRKRKSKMVFEKGVELFAEQKLPEARHHFIEVLKMAPMDKAAKYYLLRCDEYLNSECERNIFIGDLRKSS
jgi:class 3 adenylate cyclase